MNRLIRRFAPLRGLVRWLAAAGASNETESVMPTDPKDFPENKAKASMDFYREKMLKDKKGGRRN